LPTLNKKQLVRMEAKEPYACGQCGETVSQNYCRVCDVFFTEGHKPTCPSMTTGGVYSNDHRGHRTY